MIGSRPGWSSVHCWLDDLKLKSTIGVEADLLDSAVGSAIVAALSVVVIKTGCRLQGHGLPVCAEVV